MKVFCFVASMFSLFLDMCEYSESVNLSNYTYPKPHDKDLYYIAIIGTNDIHGYSFPRELVHKGVKYTYGGISVLSSYINLLRQEWGERVLWLDAGDKFQGAFENTISNGTIIRDFFNEEQAEINAIGNHDFDYGENFLFDTINESRSSYLAANILYKSGSFPNTQPAMLWKVGEITLGVIGLSTIQTPYTTKGNVTNFEFKDYKDIVHKYSTDLRARGADAVVLLSHIGVQCNLIKEGERSSMDLGMWNREISHQGQCDPKGEMYKLLMSLEKNDVDAVVGGHCHDSVHHWINEVPVIQSRDKGLYFNIMYLPFKKISLGKYQLVSESVTIEGPVPICDRIFSLAKNCDYLPHVNETLRKFHFHHVYVYPVKSIDKILRVWDEKFLSFRKIVGMTEVLLAKDYKNENVLGNFVADAFRNFTGSDISIINTGCFRAMIFPGAITLADVYSLFPFGNEVMSFEMNGEEVMKMLKICQEGEKALYATSGVRQYLQRKPSMELVMVNASLMNGTALIDTASYTISTVDFMILKGGDDFRNVISWYKQRKLTSHGKLIDLFVEYLSKIKTVTQEAFLSHDIKDRRFVFT